MTTVVLAIAALLRWPAAGDMVPSIPPDSLGDDAGFGRTFDRILQDRDAADLIGVDAGSQSRNRVIVFDSALTIDPFPFSGEGGRWHFYDDPTGRKKSETVEFYLAIALRPLRSVFVRGMQGLSSPVKPKGILFFSPREQNVIMAELFPYDSGLHGYEEYLFGTESLKFLVILDGKNEIIDVLRAHLRR